jgi:plastocyanin
MFRRFYRCLALALLLAGSAFVLVACGGGGDSGGDSNAAVTTDATPSTALSIRAKDLKFDKKALVAPPNSEVAIELVNDDGGIVHNVAIYRDKSAKEKLFVGEAFTGRKTKTETFTTPGPGTYYFRCDAHPEMNGAFIVR